MESCECIKINGIYRIYSIKNKIKKQIDEISNLIMDDVHEKVSNAFADNDFGASYEIMHLGIGDDDTTVTGTDTTLGNEVYRVPYVLRDISTSKIITTEFFITESEFSGDIEELGVFAGHQSTGTTDSGNLLSHVLWSYTKSSSEEVLVEYELTIS